MLAFILEGSEWIQLLLEKPSAKERMLICVLFNRK
jgi:hypothetical protein